MNHIFNEYIVPNDITTYSIGLVEITYDPIEELPDGIIWGIINIGTQAITFSLSADNVINSWDDTEIINICINRLREIEIIWEKLPAEHYIRLSYSFKHFEIKEFKDIDWRKEGF